MKILIFTCGSLGDIQYYIPLATELIARSHAVTICSHANFRSLVEGHGVPFASLTADMRTISMSTQGIAVNSPANPLQLYMSYQRLFGEYILTLAREALPHCKGSDLMIVNPTSMIGGYHIAEKACIPMILGNAYPMIQTKAYPSIFAPLASSSNTLYNTVTHKIEEYMEAHFCRKIVNQLRAELQLPRLRTDFSYRWRDGKQIPTLFSISPTILPRPQDWHRHVYMNGHWYLQKETKKELKLSQEIQNFLASGAPPIYIGFGSMSAVLKHALLTIAKEAAEYANERVILARGWSDFDKKAITKNILVIDHAPHRLLFPRVKLTIHHGGASTVHSALLAGKPSVIVPFAHDQFFWAERCYQIGAAPRAMRHKTLTGPRLGKMIVAVQQTNRYAVRARQIQKDMMAENGVRQSALEIEHLAKRYAVSPRAGAS